MAFEYTKKFCGYLYVQGTPQGEDIPKVRRLGSCVVPQFENVPTMEHYPP
jgi:hypothetical protein